MPIKQLSPQEESGGFQHYPIKVREADDTDHMSTLERALCQLADVVDRGFKGDLSLVELDHAVEQVHRHANLPVSVQVMRGHPQLRSTGSFYG